MKQYNFYKIYGHNLWARVLVANSNISGIRIVVVVVNLHHLRLPWKMLKADGKKKIHSI